MYLLLDDFCRLRGLELHAPVRERIYREIRDSANEIIKRKGATYYGIAMAVGRIAACIVRDEHAILPISVALEGEYGLDHLALPINRSSPPLWGKTGWRRCWRYPWTGRSGRRWTIPPGS